MTLDFSLAQLEEILDATPLDLPTDTRARAVKRVATDTRALEPGDLFVALRGTRFDGHDFLRAASEKGAIAAVARRDFPLETPVNLPILRVEDTLAAYQRIARWWRDRLDLPVVGITGSVGKTTTKELLAAVLSTRGRALKTRANNNNEIGVPKTLLELEPDHEFAVVEMAMRAEGEIAELARVARPSVGVITTVGTAHIGRLGSREAIARAKCELLAEMPASGVAVLNADNPLLMETAATVWRGETLAFGLEGGDLRGELLDANTLRVEGVDLPLPLPGEHNALNYLAALAAAKVLGVDWTPLQAGLAVELGEGRSRRLQLPGDVLILDETYNAGVESMEAGLRLLRETPGKRRVAVLGTMKELGSHSARLHRQVGETARALELDAVLVLADEPEAREIAAGAAGIPVEVFESVEALAERLLEMARAGDRLLFKASRSVKLERAIERFREGRGAR